MVTSARRKAGFAGLLFGAATASVACSAILGLTDPAPIDAGSDDASTSTSADDAPVSAKNDASCAADLSADRENCGECGHDCLGGDCTDGVCQPFVAAEADEVPHWVMLDEDRIVWSASVTVDTSIMPRIESCPRPKCTAPPTVLYQPAKYRRLSVNLVVGGGTVTWIDAMDSSSLRQCETRGCGGEPATRQEIVDNFPALAKSATGTIVYGQLPNPAVRSPVEFVRCIGPTCASTKRLLDASTTPYSTKGVFDLQFAADQERLFWAATDENDQQGLWYCRLDNCVPSFLARAPAEYLAIGEDALYWTEGITDTGNGIRILRCTLPSCVVPKQIYESRVADAFIGGIYVDASGVYFTDPSGVSFCPLDGCPDEPKRIARVGGGNLTGDARALYWVNRPQQRIYGLAR